MRKVFSRFHYVSQPVSLLLQLIGDAWNFFWMCLRPAPALAAKALFLRKQLALFEER